MGSSLLTYHYSVHSTFNPAKVSKMKRYNDSAYFIDINGNVYREGKTNPLKPDKGTMGHSRVTLSHDGITKRYLIHRMVAETYIPNPHDKPHINHIDNNPLNNHVSNLEWCTHSENMLHCHKQGRCSNIIASKVASAARKAECAEKFKKLLGDTYIGIHSATDRPSFFIEHSCEVCGAVLITRNTSLLFKHDVIMCKNCKDKQKVKMKI